MLVSDKLWLPLNGPFVNTPLIVSLLFFSIDFSSEGEAFFGLSFAFFPLVGVFGVGGSSAFSIFLLDRVSLVCEVPLVIFGFVVVVVVAVGGGFLNGLPRFFPVFVGLTFSLVFSGVVAGEVSFTPFSFLSVSFAVEAFVVRFPPDFSEFRRLMTDARIARDDTAVFFNAAFLRVKTLIVFRKVGYLSGTQKNCRDCVLICI